ncbi:MAG: hypothetical protein FWE21_03330 [Defluviitaleaceae bacterium]|nr:hypothetical protein [Defluviitaleaceae bacterium]
MSKIDTANIPEPFYRYFSNQPKTQTPMPSQNPYPSTKSPSKPDQSDLVLLMAALMLCED